MKLIVRISALTLSISLLALAIGHLILGPARAQDSPATPVPTGKPAAR
jgi:hypothetical protein